MAAERVPLSDDAAAATEAYKVMRARGGRGEGAGGSE